MRQYYEQLQRLSPFRIALIYFFVAGVWVFFSDEALEYAISDPALITKFQTYKGLFYILFTTVGLYWLIRHHSQERGETETEILESRRLLRNTFESVDESVMLVEPGSRLITDANRAAEELFGYSRDELIGKSTHNLHVNEEMYHKFDSMGTRELSETGTFKTEFRMKKKNGEVFDSDHTVSLVYDEAGEVERVVSVIRDISGKKRAEERELKSVIEAEERERRRIARELHDGIGQYLSASHMNMEAVKREAGHLSEKSRSRFETGLSLLKKAIGETRNTAHNLMPHVLEDYGLELALHTLVEKTGEGREIELVLESEIDDTALDKVASFNLYRIIQEAINNAIKHGKCSKISIKVCQGDDLLACTISDNGIGAEIDEAQAGGIGIRNMKSRVQSMSGTIAFQSKAGEGMRIDIRIPLSK